MNRKNNKIIGGKKVEKLSHFNCGACGKWWAIGDAPAKKKKWHCPWCGKEQEIK